MASLSLSVSLSAAHDYSSSSVSAHANSSFNSPVLDADLVFITLASCISNPVSQSFILALCQSQPLSYSSLLNLQSVRFKPYSYTVSCLEPFLVSVTGLDALPNPEIN